MTDQNRHYGASIVREFIAALGFLAVLHLSFAHQPVFADTDVSWRVSVNANVSGYCGYGPEGDGLHQGPCHACRVVGAELPPPPCVATPAFTAFVTVTHVQQRLIVPDNRVGNRHRTRAPPRTV